MSAFPSRAMILAAGLGTRLRPLTTDVPKPAVPICGVPPLRFNLALLSAAGVRQVVVNTHWRPEAIREAAGDTKALGLDVRFSHEPKILGTGGGLKKVASFFEEETFLLLNGKILFDADLEAAVAFHRERGAAATMVLRPYPEGATYSPIEIDREGRVRLFAKWGEVGERAPPDLRPLTRCMFTGLHVLEPRALRYLPPDRPACITSEGYLSMLRAGERVFGRVQEQGYFAEPSTPERYLSAALDLVAGRVGLDRFRAGGVDPFQALVERGAGVWLHPSATVAPSAILAGPCWIGPGTRVEDGAKVGPLSVIEQGASVGAGALVQGSVVWPDTRVESGERLEGAIASGVERVTCRA